MRLVLTLTGLLLLTGISQADAACTCRCVNGVQKALCTSTLDVAPICPPRVCPVVNPSVAPVQAPRLKPLGTTSCRMAQVYNASTQRYEWQRVCK